MFNATYYKHKLDNYKAKLAKLHSVQGCVMAIANTTGVESKQLSELHIRIVFYEKKCAEIEIIIKDNTKKTSKKKEK